MKQKQRADKHKQYLRRRRAQFNAWLSAMGFEGYLDQLPPLMADVILAKKFPLPTLQIDDPPSWWPEMRASIERRWGTVTFEPFENGVVLPVIEALSVYASLVCGLHWSLNHPGHQHLLDTFGPEPELCVDVIERAMGLLGKVIADQLAWEARIDGLLMRAMPLILPLEDGRRQVTWRITATPAAEERAVIDHKPRPVYRVAHTLASDQVKWIDLDASLIQPSPTTQKLPVLVQAHALERLHERMRFWPTTMTPEPVNFFGHFQNALAVSIEKPRIARQKGNEFLIEYHAGGYKTGYLVAELAGNRVIIKTFLLCGMEGTPEGDQLKRRLKLSRGQMEWLYLDHLDQWVNSDLTHDPAIRALLEKCGLTDLLRCADEKGWRTAPGLADTFHKFVGDTQLKRAQAYFGLSDAETAAANAA